MKLINRSDLLRAILQLEEPDGMLDLRSEELTDAVLSIPTVAVVPDLLIAENSTYTRQRTVSMQQHPYLSASWPDEELDSIRELRKLHAQQEGDAALPKDVRKEHQRYVKACTILLEYFYGTGRFANITNTAALWPTELEIYMQIALLHLWNSGIK